MAYGATTTSTDAVIHGDFDTTIDTARDFDTIDTSRWPQFRRGALLAAVGVATIGATAVLGPSMMQMTADDGQMKLEQVDADAYTDPNYGSVSSIASSNSSYCALTLVKNTQSSVDANASFYFLQDLLGTVCQYDEECDLDCKNCGQARRASLPRSSNFSEYGCFGLHSVNSAKRPQGGVPMEKLVSRFGDAMDHYKTYQPLMDQSTVLWSYNLTHFAWKADYHLSTKEFLVLEWFNLDGQRFYSIIYAVAGQMNCVEIVGAELAPQYAELAVRYNGTRYTEHVFTTAAINTSISLSTSHGYLEPLSISKATTDVAAVEKFYQEVMLAKTERYTYDGGQNNGNVSVVLVTLEDADLVLKFVQRGTAFTLDDTEMTVLEMQHVKNAAHNESYKSLTCGIDRFYDNHYAYNVGNGTNATIGSVSERLFNAGVKFTCSIMSLWIHEPVTGDVIEYSYAGAGDSFFNMDYTVPDGDKFREEMNFCIYNMTNADISDLCMQGNCEMPEFFFKNPLDQCTSTWD